MGPGLTLVLRPYNFRLETGPEACFQTSYFFQIIEKIEDFHLIPDLLHLPHP